MAGRVDNTVRRKWDRAEYHERAQQRELAERSKKEAVPAPPPTKPLKHREFDLDLTSGLGKTQLLTPLQQAGYSCDVCKCVVKDSSSYLDHINSREHQRAHGMSMRVERSTLEQVQNRLHTVKRKKEEPPATLTEEDFEMRIRKLQQEEEEKKQRRRERKKQKKKMNAQGQQQVQEQEQEQAKQPLDLILP